MQTTWMHVVSGASAALETVGRLRERTRLCRNGHWFASLVFGIVVLGAMPFYVQSTPARTPDCRSLGHHFFSCSYSGGPPLFGRAFEGTSFSALSSWSTFYWAIAIVVGFGAVVVYYRLRARKLGVEVRLWPAAVATLVLLGLVMWVDHGTSTGPRGFSVLVVIALGLLVLSALERSRPFVVFASGFFGLALLSFLYTVVNLFQRMDIGRPFIDGGYALPNLVLPGAYLTLGGLLFLVFRGRRLRLPVHIVSTTP